MELLSVIRRWHYRDHFSIREISRRTGLSRNTVRKYLRSDSVEPKFAVPDRPSRLDPYADKLSHMLNGRRRGKSRKQRADPSSNCTPTCRPTNYEGLLQSRGGFRPAIGRPPGSENRRLPAAACSCRWRLCRARHSSSTGQSADWAVIARNERTKLQVAHFKLSYSRAFILRAYPQQTHEMLFDAHNHAFRVLAGVPRRGIYPTMAHAHRRR